MVAPRSPLIIAKTPQPSGPAHTAAWSDRHPGSDSDRPADAGHVLVDMAEQAERDELLRRHGRHIGEHGSALLQLIVVQPTDHGGRRRRPLLEERDGLAPGAVGVLL